MPPPMPVDTSSRKQIPQNLDAERALLGFILLDNSALNTVVEQVSREDFFSESHRRIFQKMVELSENNRQIDVVTLSEELAREGWLEKVGGVAYLAGLSEGVPFGTSANVTEYSRIVKEKSTLRRLINISENIISRAQQEGDDAETMIDLAQGQFFEIASQQVKTGFLGIKEIVKSSFGTIDVLFDRGQRVTGIETGYTDLDNMTSGLQRAELAILASRPSVGKTALALNISAYAAIEKRKSVGVISIEMSKESLLIRLLCAQGRIDSHKLRTGFSSREDWNQMSRALGRLAEAPLYIEDAPALSIMQIRAKARRLAAERGLDLLVVDYLQLITGGGRFENRTQEVSFISRSLKGIAKELNIPVLALSQLNRAPEGRTGHRPQLSDLRESGSIEQDADVVLFLHRPEMYRHRDDDEGGDEPAGKTELNVSKQRNGPTGQVNLVFLKPYALFENYSSLDEPLEEPLEESPSSPRPHG